MQDLNRLLFLFQINSIQVQRQHIVKSGNLAKIFFLLTLVVILMNLELSRA
jgi:hypothetical protein